MARVALGQMDRYSSGNRGFFKLADDGDVAQVRFLYEGEEDLDIFCVHKINVGGQERYVSCLRDTPDAPVDDCPLCREGNGRMVRMFLQIAKVTRLDPKTSDDVAWESQIWDRGPNFAKKMDSLCRRNKPLHGTLFEIERCGKAGSQDTTYEVYQIKQDGLKLEELPAKKELLGSVILDKSYEDLDAFVLTGQFPDEAEESESQPTRRGRGVSAQAAPQPTRRAEPVEEEDDFLADEEPQPRARSRSVEQTAPQPASRRRV